MRDKPNECYAANCPLAVTCRCGHDISEHVEESNCAHVTATETGEVPCACNEFRSKGHGFVLGVGNPATAKYMQILEAPGKDEIAFQLMPVSGRSFFATQAEVDAEIARRKQAYPTLEMRYIRTGVPIVGATGTALEMWVYPKVGMKRDEFFIDNTLRCLPPKGKSAAYPTGTAKKEAERACRMWDRVSDFKPDTAVATLHPAGILREITPLPLLIKDMERVRDFTVAGRRVMALLGGKAVQAFLRFGENVTKWRGHYVLLAEDWASTYRALFEFVVKKRVKKEAKPLPTRPAELSPVACKSFKRYKGTRVAPRCGCAPCWDTFERVQAELAAAKKAAEPVVSTPAPKRTSQQQSFAKWDEIFDVAKGREVRR